jgi:hypothetical protein
MLPNLANDPSDRVCMIKTYHLMFNPPSVYSTSPTTNNCQTTLFVRLTHHKIIHCEAFGVQLTASVSIINSGLGLPGVANPPSDPANRTTLSRTVYVVPGFNSSIFAWIWLFLFFDTSFALIDLLLPSVSHFYVGWFACEYNIAV